MADDLPELIKFSDLKEDHPLTLDGNDTLIAVAHPNPSSETGYSSLTTTPTQLAQFAVEEQTFANLKTSSKTVENSINQTISNLADDYDNTATYDVDDCVLYAGNLYKCITAIPVAEEWDSTHWTQIKAVDVGSGGGGELPTYEKSASGSVVSFTDGGDDIPVKSFVVNITGTNTGEGDVSPDNPYTIIGFDNVVVTQSGINVWDEQWEIGTINANTGLPEADNSRVRSKNFILCRPSTSYYALPNVQVFGYDEQSEYIEVVSSSASGAVFTTPANCYYLKFRTPNTYGGTYNNDLGINYPSTETTYKAYKGTVLSFALGQTIYQGTLNVLSGELTINKAIDVYDGSVDEDWSLQSINQYDIANFTIGRTPNPYIESNRFEEQSSSISQTTTEGFYASTNFYFRINKTRAEDVASFRQWLASNNVIMIYELQTPLVINLTPVEVRTLLGENNIYANCGNVNITYFTNSAGEISDLIEAYTGNVVTLYTTLATGGTSVTITNSAIKTNSTIDIYCDPDTLYNSVTVTDGQIVIAFDAQANDVKVKVRVS